MAFPKEGGVGGLVGENVQKIAVICFWTLPSARFVVIPLGGWGHTDRVSGLLIFFTGPSSLHK